MTASASELVGRIWARDATLWTGSGEERWLGWLDEPERMRARVGELEAFAQGVAAGGLTDVVLLGMGGSSLTPEVFRRAHPGSGRSPEHSRAPAATSKDPTPPRFHVLDTTHPDAIRSLASVLDPDRTLFVVASKSGTTLETRCHLDLFWEGARRQGDRFVAITDPGSELETLAQERSFRAIWAGNPEIGGRYSALSVFGLVPAALLGADLAVLLDRATETAAACRGEDGNPGLELGLALGRGWQAGRDKVAINPTPYGFGLWAEQLLAESTGKAEKGLVPCPGESPDGQDRQEARVELAAPADLGRELYRFEFATAVAAALMGVNPFDQPNVQEAKDRTSAILAAGGEPSVEPLGSLGELLAQAHPGDYLCVQAFVEESPAADAAIECVRARARAEAGIATTAGYGPRYLHSTGQLHKGGPPTGLFLQVVDDPEELLIPGRPFGFRRLLLAQAAGDLEALRERGRRVARVRFGDL